MSSHNTSPSADGLNNTIIIIEPFQGSDSLCDSHPPVLTAVISYTDLWFGDADYFRIIVKGQYVDKTIPNC